MKRKNLECVYDDFSSFPFYPSPRKSRRLNCELVPIDEDEMLTSSSSIVEKKDAEIIEAADSIGDRLGDDRALVLFYPNSYAPILRPIAGPSFSVIVNSDLIPSIKGNVLRPSDLNNSLIKLMNELPTQSNNNADQNRWLRVVPWLETQKQEYYWLQAQETGLSSMPMDTEESDSDMMDTDNNAITNYNSVQELQINGFTLSAQHSNSLLCKLKMLVALYLVDSK